MTSVAPRRNDNLERLRGALVAGIMARCRLSRVDAEAWATTLLDVLRQEAGGERLGPGGFYIQAPETRSSRDLRIVELAGPPPHSRHRVHLVARNVGCHVATVWRVLARAAGDS